MNQEQYSLTPERLAASIHGAGHVDVTSTGVVPSHFTPWVTERVMSPTFTVVASAAGGARLRLETSASRIRITFTPHRITYSSDAPLTPFVAVSDAVSWVPAPIGQELGRLLLIQPDGSVVEREGPSGSMVLERPVGVSGSAVDVHLPIDAAVILHSVSGWVPG